MQLLNFKYLSQNHLIMASTNEVNESEKRTTKKSLLIDLTATSEDIEKSFVSEKTTSIYIGILV